MMRGKGRKHKEGEFESSPFVSLVCAVYEQAIKDFRDYPLQSWECKNAYAFLMKDPYNVLPDAARDQIKREYEQRERALKEWRGGTNKNDE